LAISENTKDFIESLIDYYISEAESYKQLAESYAAEIESITDTTFGIITGCVYSGFLQAYASQNQTASLEDIQDFNKILMNKAALIKNAILGKSDKQEEKLDSPKIESDE